MPDIRSPTDHAVQRQAGALKLCHSFITAENSKEELLRALVGQALPPAMLRR